MATIMPEGEALRNAVKWVCAKVDEKPGSTHQEFVSEAVFRFDLSPMDADFLLRFFQDKQD